MCKFVFLILFMGIFHCSWSQKKTVNSSNEIWRKCPQIKTVPATDTLAWRASIDSIAMQLKGRWHLISIRDGWNYPTAPNKYVEIVFSPQGQGKIYEDSILVATVNIHLRRKWDMILFDIEQKGASIFNLPATKGMLQVCDDKLFLSDTREDSVGFAFQK